MKSFPGFKFSCAGLALVLVCLHGAAAETLKEKVSTLEPLTLHYGANNITLNTRNILIVRGSFESETAWGGDGYAVLIDEGGKWQFARLGDGPGNEVIVWSVPHTQEDAVTSISFMVPKGVNAAKNAAKLYLLKTHRKYNESPLDSAAADFTLYVLKPADDFGIFYFRELLSQTSSAKYCNADSAAYHELGIPLPGDGTEFSCAGSE